MFQGVPEISTQLNRKKPEKMRQKAISTYTHSAQDTH
jgi:hypothetical protein